MRPKDNEHGRNSSGFLRKGLHCHLCLLTINDRQWSVQKMHIQAPKSSVVGPTYVSLLNPIVFRFKSLYFGFKIVIMLKNNIDFLIDDFSRGNGQALPDWLSRQAPLP